MKTQASSVIEELPEKMYFSRQETATLLRIGLSTLDSKIGPELLPRVRMRKRVYFLRSDIEKFILANRYTGEKHGN
ncbi:MAG: DNA-binding protein [Treponema sp.]|jgi:hypothetical protein